MIALPPPNAATALKHRPGASRSYRGATQDRPDGGREDQGHAQLGAHDRRGKAAENRPGWQPPEEPPSTSATMKTGTGGFSCFR